jgi:hypothetical protein
MALNQCALCGNLFSGCGKVCSECSKELDDVFTRSRKYIYSTSEPVSVTKLVEDLDVPEDAVNYLVKEGRLSVLAKAQGRTGKCKVCGAVTDGQALCAKCRASFSDSVRKYNAERQTSKKPSSSEHGFHGVIPLGRDKKD